MIQSKSRCCHSRKYSGTYALQCHWHLGWGYISLLSKHTGQAPPAITAASYSCYYIRLPQLNTTQQPYGALLVTNYMTTWGIIHIAYVETDSSVNGKHLHNDNTMHKRIDKTYGWVSARKTTPLLTHWSYVFLALTHQYIRMASYLKINAEHN